MYLPTCPICGADAEESTFESFVDVEVTELISQAWHCTNGCGVIQPLLSQSSNVRVIVPDNELTPEENRTRPF